MLKKQIGHMAVVSMKYFFDMDYIVCHHLFIVLLVVLSLFKLFFSSIGYAFYDSWLTVKDDYMVLKNGMHYVRDRVAKAAEKELARYNTNMLKEVFSGNFRNWKLD